MRSGVALGLKAHSGWAALVALRAGPELLDRSRRPLEPTATRVPSRSVTSLSSLSSHRIEDDPRKPFGKHAP